MQPRLFRMAILLVLAAMFLTAASKAAPEQATMPYNEVSNVAIDGTINANEYAGSYSETTTGMNIYWEHNGTVMYIGMESPGTGWVGIGFGPVGTGMDGANIIIGYVDDTTGDLTLADNIGEGWSHYSDNSQDGSDDIIDKAGSQSQDKTMIEFVFPLDSGDSPYDYPLAAGSTFGFFVAYHANKDDLTTPHSKHSGSIELYIEPSPTVGENQLPKASFDFTVTELTVEFTDQSTDADGNLVSWLWKFGDGANSTDQNPSHAYSEMDTYAVSLTVTDDKGGTNTASISIMVPSAEQRMQLWITQVAILTVAIAFVSFTAVGIARKTEAKKEGK